MPETKDVTLRTRAGTLGRHLALASVLAVLVVAGSCERTPTAPTQEEPGPEAPDRDTPAVTRDGGSGVFSDEARVLDPAAFQLTSSAEELEAGLYRYQAEDDAPFPDVARDQFLVVGGENPEVRLVLSTERVGDELVIDTSPGRWSDVIQSGTYGVTMPFSPEDGPATTLAGFTLDPITVGPLEDVGLPRLQAEMEELDICQLVHDVLDPLGLDPEICGLPRSISLGLGVVSITLEGNLDSLVLEEGHVGLTGDMDLVMKVDGGGITGGRAPVFAPCDRGNYTGCLNTPAGAALRDFLRKYAPSVPEEALPAARICIPGTSIRIRRGYWSGSFPNYTWNPARWETCRVTDAGELPTIVLPSVQEVGSDIRPRVKGEMTFRVKGDGSLDLKIAIPGAAATAGYGGQHFAAKATAGLFVNLKLELKNAGGTVRVEFDENGVINQEWTHTDGWDHGYTMTSREVNTQLVRYETPDSIVFRAGVLAEVSAGLCAALISCEVKDDDDEDETSEGIVFAALAGDPDPDSGEIAALTNLAVGLKIGAAGFYGSETTFSRHQVNPDDPEITNFQFAQEALMELKLSAGLTIPGSWLMPSGALGRSETFEFGRIPLTEIWGVGALRVRTNTTGENGPAGYEVLVSRYDTLPPTIRPGAERVGQPTEHGRNLWEPVDATGSVLFADALPCQTFYSDAAVAMSPAAHAVVSGLRATGVDVPTYALTSPCGLLIARYNVRLTGVPENCTVEGGADRDDVWLHQINPSLDRFDPLKEIEFEVDCTSSEIPLGAVEATTVTTGRPPDDAYVLSFGDGGSGGLIGANETLLVDGLATGTREIRLDGVPPDCQAEPAEVEIVANETVQVTLEVECPTPGGEAGDVTITWSLIGATDPSEEFEVRVDGLSRTSLPFSGTAWVHGIPPLTPTVFLVANMDPGCRALSTNPTLITLDEDASPQTLDFGSECTLGAIDTLRGDVEATGWPTPVVHVRTQDGVTTPLRGVVVDEIAQLHGSPVRVWGVQSGMGLDVYGYDLRTTLADPRWMGILVLRDDQLWLMGEEAVRLIDPPATLEARLGALVWVSGPRTSSGITPFISGVLREAQP